ncbi:MAG: glycosyltransferase family 39 protein [Tepidisphaeraceae bacterium]
MAESVSTSADVPPGQGPSAPWYIRHWALLLVALLGVGVFFRMKHASDVYPTLDEQWHLNLSTGRGTFIDLYPEQTLFVPPAVTSIDGAPPVWHIWTHMQGVLHPPLYVMLLRLWRDVLGDSDITAITFSVAASLAALMFLFMAVRRRFGMGPAVASTLMMAVSASQSWIGIQIRGYAVVLAFCCALLWVIARIETLGPSRLRTLGATLLILALMLTHYFAVAACAVAAIYLLVVLRGRHRWEMLGGLVLSGAVYVLAWGPFFIQQAHDIAALGDSWLVDPNQTIDTVIRRFLSFPLRSFYDDGDMRWSLAIVSGLIYVAAIALSFRWRDLRLWTLWMLATPLLLLALDAERHTIHLVLFRYFTPSTPAVFVVLTVMLWRTWRPLPLVLAPLAFAAALVWGTTPDRRGSPQYFPISFGIAASQSDDPAYPIVITNDGGPPWQAKGMLMELSHNLLTRGRTAAWVQSRADPAFVQQLAGKKFWATGFPALHTPEQILPGAKRLETYRAVGDYYFALMEVPSSPATAPISTRPTTLPASGTK